MPEDFYALRLRPVRGESLEITGRELSERVLRVPGVRRLEPGRFLFSDTEQGPGMSIDFNEADSPLAMVEIAAPRSWVMEYGPRLFALVFMMAEWSAAEVFDPQIDSTLQKEAVLQGLVAVRQAQREREAAESPPTVEDYVPENKLGPDESSEPSESKKPWWKRLGS